MTYPEIDQVLAAKRRHDPSAVLTSDGCCALSVSLKLASA